MKNNLPTHVFVIPDGNRRWARKRNLMPWEGHREGTKKFYEISETAFNYGIPYFTFWAASENNLLKRNPLEVRFLIKLIREEIENRITEKLFKNQIRLRVIGNWEKILSDKKLSDCIHSLEEKTAFFFFANYHLTILLGYSGKTEIAEAAKILYKSEIDSENMTFDTVKDFSWTRDLPPVDLEIRTGEEKTDWSHRSSGALPFLTANSVCHHTKTLWPDFSKEQFFSLLEEYAMYERRLGK